jgi:anthranilate phosphoribosyltransferase
MKTHEAIKRVLEGHDLSGDMMELTVSEIMDGTWTAVQIAAFLTALRMKGETVQELTGAAKAMKSRAHGVVLDDDMILDTCGTGGDGADTFNISTTVAFVVAAAGIPVAKHGNRSVSSRSGSADVLEALGVNLSLNGEQVGACIREVGLGFLYAPAHHPAMKHAAPVRRELGFRTLFNLLGPLTNPANATHQLIGIFDGNRVTDIARVLGEMGTHRSMVVHGSDGLDEVTLSGPTSAALVENGIVTEMTITPDLLGLPEANLEEMKGGDAQDNASITTDILSGNVRGPKLDIVLANAGVALLVAQRCGDLKEGVEMARALIDNGAAFNRLKALVEYTGRSA